MKQLPRDNFRREREFKTVSAKQFDNVGPRVKSYKRVPVYRKASGIKFELKKVSPPDILNFSCATCSEEIPTTEEQRQKKMTTICPKCHCAHKLHTAYVTCEGLTIQYILEKNK